MKTIPTLAALILIPAALATAPAVATAGGVKSIDLRMELTQTQLQTAQDVNRDGIVAYQLITRYKGRPGGRAEGMGFSEVGEPLADTSGCPATMSQPFALPIVIFEETLVFNDLSSLFLSGSGLFCVDLATFQGVASASFNVVGGTGRFAGATGAVQIDFPQYFARYMEYSVVTGTLTGTVQVAAD